MKKNKEIVKDIENQIEILEGKNIKPEILLLGDMVYFTLKSHNLKLLEKTSNCGSHLKDFMGLRVITKPIYETGGIYTKDCETVEVLGK